MNRIHSATTCIYCTNITTNCEMFTLFSKEESPANKRWKKNTCLSTSSQKPLYNVHFGLIYTTHVYKSNKWNIDVLNLMGSKQNIWTQNRAMSLCTRHLMKFHISLVEFMVDVSFFMPSCILLCWRLFLLCWNEKATVKCTVAWAR